MEFNEAGSSHKHNVEPLVISSSPSSDPLSEADVSFSDDYVDSPQSSGTKSPLESCGSCQSDDQSSLGTIETEDDADDVAPGKRRPDLHLLLDPPPSEKPARMTAGQHDDEDEDDNEFGAHAVPRRSTSLKTCKTPPPGSARQKKEVRFADALGLDLESVKHIKNTTEPPIVPASAVRHLVIRSESADFTPYRRRLLHTCFSQPGMSRNFAERVADRRVSLETCLVSDTSIDCVIRVANIAFEKRVSVRYTMNGWLAYTDIPATYIHGSSTGSTDQFRFSIALPSTFGVINNAVEFSVRYEAGHGGDTVYWDSNYGANYRIECYMT